MILDRNNVVLASNRPDFRLYVSHDKTTDVEDLLDRLQKLVPLDDAHRARLIDDINDAPLRAPVTVLEDLTWEEFSRISVRAPELPGVTADQGDIRVYPFPAAFAHVIGYVAKVSKADVTKEGPNSDSILLNPGMRIGKAGIEKTYDLPMRGKAGAKKVEVDVKGRVVREDPGGDIASTPGQVLQLTLDADIQNRALEIFGTDSGAAVMMDCRTGDILCMLSAPSFDANRFVKGITGPEYRSLAEYDHKPLFNKSVTATYPPGSTFKTMVAMTALEMGIPTSTTHTCNKSMVVGRSALALRRGARHARHEAGHLQVVRHLLLPARASHWRSRRDREDRAHDGPGRDLRHRRPVAAGRTDPHRRMGQARPAQRPGLAPGRDAQRRHRPGRGQREPAPTLRDVLPYREWQEGALSAAGALDRRGRAAASRGRTAADRSTRRTWTSCTKR